MTDKIEKEVAQKPASVIAEEKAKVLNLQELENIHGGFEAEDCGPVESVTSLNCR
jgi:hypothetical protein